MFIVCLFDSDSKFSHVNFKLSLAYCQAGIHSQCRVVTKSCDIWFRVHFSAVFVDVWAGDFVFVHGAGVEVTEHRCIASALWSGHRCAVKASDGQLQPCSVDLPQSRGTRPCWTVRHGGMDLFSPRGETVQRTSHPHRSYVFEGVFETSPVGSETSVSVVTFCMFPICVSLDGNTYSRPWWRHDAADVWRNWICFTHRWQPRDLLLQRRWSTFTLCPEDTFSRTGESSCDLCYVYSIHFFVATVCSLPVKYS